MNKWSSIRVLMGDQIKIHKKYNMLEVPDIHNNPLYILAVKSDKVRCEDCVLWVRYTNDTDIEAGEGYRVNSVTIGYCQFETEFYDSCLANTAKDKLGRSKLAMTFSSIDKLSLFHISYMRVNNKL